MHLRTSRRRLTPVALAAGLIGSAILGFGATGTFSALTATVTNTNDTAGTGTIVMQETDGNSTQTGSCRSDSGSGNSTTCAAFNKYGGSTSLLPGSGTSTSTIRIFNVGTLPARQFTITPLTCSVPAANNPAGTTGNICDYLTLTLTCTVTSAGSSAAAVQVYDGTKSAASLSKIAANGALDLRTAKACTPPPGPAGGNSYTTFNFSVTLDSSAGNDIQGQTATQQIQWQFTA